MDTIRMNTKQVKMVAHRGLSGIERENTCPAFVAAGNRSYFGIETDVRVTKDGKFVLLHDASTKRVTDGAVDVSVVENEFSAVRDILLPDKDGSTDRRDIRIPQLAEYVRICKKYDKMCVLEVKEPFADEDLARMVAEITALGYIDGVIFIAFDFGICTALRRLLPESTIQWLTWNKENALNEEMAKTLAELRLDVDVYYKNLTKETVDMLHAHGIRINCWTCDDPAQAERLIAMGVDFITSNILE